MEQWASDGVSNKALENFAAQLVEKGTELHVIEIFEQGECMVRWAIAPYSCEDKREIYSLSKSFTSTAIGIAFDNGRLRLDDLLSRYFPQQIQVQCDERWKRVKLHHLLSMTTGHADCPMPQMALGADAVSAFFEAPLAHEPGDFFAYSTGASCILAEVVRRSTGQTVTEYLSENLFEPMGIENVCWESCADGRIQGGTGLKASCDDVAKLGLLYCQKGMWQGRRLLSEKWIEMATQRQVGNNQNGTPDWCAGYGFQFWMNKDEGFRGDGAFGQLCIVLPEREIVIAVMAESVDMPTELDIIWELMSELKSNKHGVGLPQCYLPKSERRAEKWSSGWLQCLKNPMGFSSVNLQQAEDSVELHVNDGERYQTIHAGYGRWIENRLWAKNLCPTLYRQMPRGTSTELHMMVAAYQKECRLILECRTRNTPHTFYWEIFMTDDGIDVCMVSPLDIFGQSASWGARKIV